MAVDTPPRFAPTGAPIPGEKGGGNLLGDANEVGCDIVDFLLAGDALLSLCSAIEEQDAGGEVEKGGHEEEREPFWALGHSVQQLRTKRQAARKGEERNWRRFS